MNLTRRQRIHAYFNVPEGSPNWRMKWAVYNNFLDHGVFRSVYGNFFRLDNSFYRSAQPNYRRLFKFKELGGETVLSLRGCTTAPYWFDEKNICNKLGLRLENIPLSATEAPSVNQLKELMDFFGNSEKPLLVHCKSGADRTGLASFVYLTVFKGVPFYSAKRQLSVKYFHNRYGKSGILDDFIKSYRSYQELHGVSFEEWLYCAYDPNELKRSLLINS